MTPHPLVGGGEEKEGGEMYETSCEAPNAEVRCSGAELACEI